MAGVGSNAHDEGMADRPDTRNPHPRSTAARRSWLALVLSVILFGCSSTLEPGGRDAQQAYEAFVECMRDHGANVGTPVVQADGSLVLPPGEGALTPRAELIEAAAQCQPILSARGLPSPGPVVLDDGVLRELKQQSVAFASCLRESGIDWPVPSWKGGAITNWDPSTLSVDLADPQVQGAGDACAEKTGFDPLLAHALEDGDG